MLLLLIPFILICLCRVYVQVPDLCVYESPSRVENPRVPLCSDLTSVDFFIIDPLYVCKVGTNDLSRGCQQQCQKPTHYEFLIMMHKDPATRIEISLFP
jgi:hypothetical protein